MHLSTLADEYLDTINSLSSHLKVLEESLNHTNNFETKRKIRDKILAHEVALRQTLKTYHYIKNYYNRETTYKSWI